jgi:hypothetical protein
MTYIYASPTSPAFNGLTTTLDLGDVQIPRSYAQVLAAPESFYWRDAIHKELRGLLDLGTFEFFPFRDIPPVPILCAAT